MVGRTVRTLQRVLSDGHESGTLASDTGFPSAGCRALTTSVLPAPGEGSYFGALPETVVALLLGLLVKVPHSQQGSGPLRCSIA